MSFIGRVWAVRLGNYACPMSTETTETGPCMRVSDRPGNRAGVEVASDQAAKETGNLNRFFDAEEPFDEPQFPPRAKKALRPTVMAAARTLGAGQVAAARDPSRGSLPVAVVRTENGRLFVVPDECPHDGGLLSDGFIEAGRLVCARHGWEFDPETGQCPQRSVCIESRRLLRKRRVPTLPLPLVPSPLMKSEIATVDPQKD